MHISEIMDTGFSTISANDYAIEAQRIMTTRQCPWLFVLDRNELAGIICARDLERYSEATLRDRDVREFMVTSVLPITSDADIQEAERMLRGSSRGFLAVVKEGRPVGVITPKSLVRPGRKFNLQAS